MNYYPQAPLTWHWPFQPLLKPCGSCNWCMGKTFIAIIQLPRFKTDTRLIRTPRYYGQFFLSLALKFFCKFVVDIAVLGNSVLKSFVSVFTHSQNVPVKLWRRYQTISSGSIKLYYRSTRIYEAYLSRVDSFVSVSSGRITKAPSAMVVFKGLIPVFFLSCFIH